MNHGNHLYDSALHADLVLRLAEQSGVPRAVLCAEAGVEEPPPTDFTGTVPYAVVAALLETARRRLDEPALALRMAEWALPLAKGLVGFYVLNSARLRDAIGHSYGILTRVSNVFRVELGETPREGRFVLEPTDRTAPLLEVMAEFHLATFVGNNRRYVSNDFAMWNVRLPGPRPGHAKQLEDYFGCAVEHGAPCAEVVYDAAWLDRPVVDADAELRQILEPYAKRELERLPQGEDLLERTRHAIRLALENGGASLEGTAGAMGMRPRTLQHALRQAGQSYQGLLDTVREALAREALRAGEGTESVAAQLGYADATSFARAFRRWTGTTPRNFRDDR